MFAYDRMEIRKQNQHKASHDFVTLQGSTVSRPHKVGPQTETSPNAVSTQNNLNGKAPESKQKPKEGRKKLLPLFWVQTSEPTKRRMNYSTKMCSTFYLSFDATL